MPKKKVTELDREWCSDYTKIGHVLVLAAIDLSTRLIIGCQVFFKPELPLISGDASKDLIRFVEDIICKRSITPTLFHSDKGGTYNSQDFRDFLKSRDITQSFSIDLRFGNQVIERWNRTFKERIRSKLRLKLGPLTASQSKKVLNLIVKLSDDEIRSLVLEVVEEYNNSSHTHLDGVTPHIMEEALLFQSFRNNYPPLTPLANASIPLMASSSMSDRYILSKPVKAKAEDKENAIIEVLSPLVATTSKNPDHELIKSFKRAALKDLSEHWYGFILELATFFNNKLDSITSTLAQNQRETISAISLSKDETIANVRTESSRVIESQKAELSFLKSQLDEQTEVLNFLKNEEVSRKFQEKRRLEAAEHRRNRTRKPIRDAASLPEVNAVLKYISNSDKYRSEFVRSRDRIAILVLYFTGLRIGNLQVFTSNNLSSLLNPDDETRILSIRLIKTGVKNRFMSFPIAREYYNIISYYREDILALQKDKEGEDLVFTAEGSKTPKERAGLTTSINKLLSNASKEFKKTISSHSLRIGHINALIEEFGIDTAQKLVDHKDIKTTSAYARHFLDKRATTECLKKVAKRKEQRFKRHKESSVYSDKA